LWPLLLERAEAEAMAIVAVMKEQHHAIATAHEEKAVLPLAEKSG
jgi:hypothetical protein